jgi:hypothetical protein
MMVDPVKAEAVIRLGKQAANRMNGVRMIREAFDDTWEATIDEANGRVAEEKMEKATFHRIMWWSVSPLIESLQT